MSTFNFGGASSSQPSSGFGTSAPGHSAAGTLFGTQSSGFGATNTATPSSAGTLFGNPPNNSSSAGTLFGSTATPTTSATGTFGFGANTSTPASSTPGFGGFGASQPATSAPSFGGFGTSQPATSMPSFGGFGTSQQTPAATGFGGFGTSAATTVSTAPTTTSFGGFGNNLQQQQQQQQQQQPQSNTGFSGFGFGNTQQQSQQQQQQPQQQKTGFGGFGGFGTSTPTTGFGGFGNNQQQQVTTNAGSGLFGQKQPTTSFGFGQSAATSFGQTQQQPQQPQPQYNIWQQLALIKAHWDPNSPLCQFRHYFYNMVPPNEVHLYVRPPNQDEQLWNEAQQKNPDSSCMVPVLAIGFEDILKRMDTQDRQAELHKDKLNELDQRLETVRRKYELGTKARLDGQKRRHTYLTQRLIRLLRLVQVLRYKGFPLNSQEEQYQKQFEELSTQPNNPEQLYAKMLELWSQIQTIKQTRATSSEGHWEALNQNDTNRIAKVLADEQQGLSHVITILKKDLDDVQSLESKLKLEAKNKENKQPLPA